MKIKLEGRVDMAFDSFGELKRAQLIVNPDDLRDAIQHFNVGEEVIVKISSKDEN